MTRPSIGIGAPSGGAPPSEERLSSLLVARGAEPVVCSLTLTLPPRDIGPLHRAVAGIAEYDWVVVTSARAVPPVVEALREAGLDGSTVRAAGVRVCAVGPATGEALAEVGLLPDLTPRRYEASGVVEALMEAPGEKASAGEGGALRGLRVLFPRAEEGRDVIPEELRALGAIVDLVTAYRTVPDPEGAARFVELVAEGGVDAIAFTAGSAARSFASAWGDRGSLPSPVGIVAIGPSTAAALTEAGLPLHEVADPHTLEGLLTALDRWAAGRIRR